MKTEMKGRATGSTTENALAPIPLHERDSEGKRVLSKEAYEGRAYVNAGPAPEWFVRAYKRAIEDRDAAPQ